MCAGLLQPVLSRQAPFTRWSPLCCCPCLPAVAGLSGEEQVAHLLKWPAIRDTFLIKQGGKVRTGGRRAGRC